MPPAKRKENERENEGLKKSRDNDFYFVKSEFQQLWFRIRNEAEVELRKSIIRSVLVSKVFTVAQAVSIIKLFHSSSDKIEVLECCTTRLTNIEQKHEFIPQFPASLRPYVDDLVDTSIVNEPYKGSQRGIFLLKSLTFKVKKDMQEIFSALSASAFSTNQKQVISAIMRRSPYPLTHEQAFQILIKFVNSDNILISVTEIISPYILGFTVREASLILQAIENSEVKLALLKSVSTTLLDRENANILVYQGFAEERAFVKNEAMEVVRRLPLLPRSLLFGTIVKENVVFVIDVSESMLTVYETNQKERINRLRTVVRELCAVIKSQCACIDDCRINIIAHCGSAVHVWKSEGLVLASPSNANDACLWLRQLKPSGRCSNFHKALTKAFDRRLHTRVDCVYYVTDNFPNDIPKTAGHIQKAREAFEVFQGNTPVVMHTTLLNAGFHYSDNVQNSQKWTKILASSSGGISRALVDDNFVETLKSLQSKKSWDRPAVDPVSSVVIKILIFFSYIGMMGAVYAAQFVPIGGQRCQDVSHKYPTFLTPVDNAFAGGSHLNLFLDGLLVFILTLPADSTGLDRATLKIVGPKLTFYHILEVAWVFLFQNDELLLASMVLFAMLGTLILVYMGLGVGKRPGKLVSWAEAFFLHMPLGAMLAWLSFISIICFSSFCVKFEWYGFGLQAEWAVIMLVFLFALTFVMLTLHGDFCYACMMNYCFLGVMRMNWDSARSLGDVSNATWISETYVIFIVSFTFFIITGCLALQALVIKVSYFLYRPGSGQRGEVTRLAKQQANNLSSWVLMVLTNIMTSSTGPTYMGFTKKRPPLNFQTCGGIARYSDAPRGDVSAAYRGTVRVMPHRYVFSLFYVLYAWMGLFAIVQIIPYEFFSIEGNTYSTEDKSLDRFVILRKTKTFFQCFSKRIQISKWRLTMTAHGRFSKSIGNSFTVMCWLNIAFILCFSHRTVVGSFIVMLLLLLASIDLYKKADISPVRVKEKSEAEKQIIREQFDEAHKNSNPEIRRDKWERIEAKINQKNKPLSCLEVLLLHTPISLYLGLVSFCFLLMTSYFVIMVVPISAEGWNMGGFTEEGWAWSMMSLVGLVLVVFAQKRTDPFLLIGYAIPVFGVFLQNTISSCDWHTTSGVAIRRPNSAMLNQKVLADDLKYDAGGSSGGMLMWFWNLTDDKGVTVDATYRNDNCNVECQCKNAVEKFGLTYYDKNTNPLGDYKFVNGRCRRIYKDKTKNPITDSAKCMALGMRDIDVKKDIVKGYRWMDNICVEDPGVCPYAFGSSPISSHTPEYVIATSSLYLSGVLLLLSLFLLFQRFKSWKKSKKKYVAWKNIFNPGSL